MAAQTLQMYPPPPRVPVVAIPNPHHRKPSLSNVIVASALKIEEADIPVPQIPQEYKAQTQTPPVSSEENTGIPISSSPVPGPEQASTEERYTPREYSGKISDSPEPPSFDSGYRSGTDDVETTSAIVPIRSMFPTYNPNVPLSQQNYQPQQLHIGTQISPSFYSQDEYHDRQQTSRVTVDYGRNDMAIPLKDLHSKNARFSSPKELDRLWQATQGMKSNDMVKTFDLELARTNDATFTFGSDPAAPFYSLVTYDTNEIAISKTCPRKRSVVCDVALCSLEPSSRRTIPGDGLISFIFPKMAAMLAINQSAVLSREHDLAPTHRDEVQATAVKRAADQEACYLRWIPSEKRYELEHPAIGRCSKEPNFIMSPTSPLPQQKPVLHINISTGQVGSPEGAAGLPIITVINPLAEEGIHLTTTSGSHSPVTSENELASLNFNTRTLHINAYEILELMPSLCVIDSVISAIMAVALADAVTNSVMANMENWLPPVKPIGSTCGGSPAMRSYAGSAFYATLAEREEAETEAKVMQAEHDKDLRKARKQHRRWFGKSQEPKQKSKKQIVMGEFDVEKLLHYQSGARKGQQLPSITRALVSALIASLKLVVWFLITIVQFLTWLLVNGTRAVTSEKF